MIISVINEKTLDHTTTLTGTVANNLNMNVIAIDLNATVIATVIKSNEDVVVSKSSDAVNNKKGSQNLTTTIHKRKHSIAQIVAIIFLSQIPYNTIYKIQI